MTGQVVRHTMDLAGTDVPVIDITGAADGPQLTVISGVHGCEYASMAGVRRWAAALDPARLRGRVRVVPVLNITGFWARAPFVVPEDGKNLNRCFPGNPDGTLAERLAHVVFTEFIQGADGLVDAHCGDMVEALEPFAMYEAGSAEGRAKALAEAYGLGYVMRQEPGPDRAVGGTTSAAAAAIGVAAITAEAGGCGLIEQAAVDLHIRGLDSALAALAMDGPGAANGAAPPTVLSQFLWLRSQAAGWWQPAVGPGDSVATGQLLGTVSTLDGGEILQSVHAPRPECRCSSPARRPWRRTGCCSAWAPSSQVAARLRSRRLGHDRRGSALAHHRTSGGRPVLHATAHVDRLPASIGQGEHHPRRPGAGSADHVNGVITRDLGGAMVELGERDMSGGRRVAGYPFVWLPHVKQPSAVRNTGRRYLRHRLRRSHASLPRRVVAAGL